MIGSWRQRTQKLIDSAVTELTQSVDDLWYYLAKLPTDGHKPGDPTPIPSLRTSAPTAKATPLTTSVLRAEVDALWREVRRIRSWFGLIDARVNALEQTRSMLKLSQDDETSNKLQTESQESWERRSSSERPHALEREDCWCDW